MRTLKLKISIKVPFFSTEDRLKLESLIYNLLGELPNLTEIKEADLVYLTANDIDIRSLRPFYVYIREHEIIDTVRKYAIVNPVEQVITFNIHKQALTVGKIAVVSEDTSPPLGNAELTIQVEDTEKFLKWFTPKTIEGKVQNPTKFKDIFNL